MTQENTTTTVDFEKLHKEQEERFEKYEKAPSYDELVPLGRTWKFYEDFEMYDEAGDEREPVETLEEVTVAHQIAREWQSRIESFINDCEQYWNDGEWEDSVPYAAEEMLGVGFSEDGGGWHDGDPEHPSVMRARHLAELDVIRWLCKRHGIAIPEEMEKAITERKAKIDRDLQAKMPPSTPQA